MSQKWLDAAERYKRQKEEKERQQEADKTAKVNYANEIDEAALQLQRFINSVEGRAALALLAASGRHLIFGEQREAGIAVVDFIDGTGLHRSIEAHGMWMAYANKEEIPPPEISSITPQEAVRSAVSFGKLPPKEVLPWLRGELDQIAEVAG